MEYSVNDSVSASGGVSGKVGSRRASSQRAGDWIVSDSESDNFSSTNNNKKRPKHSTSLGSSQSIDMDSNRLDITNSAAIGAQQSDGILMPPPNGSSVHISSALPLNNQFAVLSDSECDDIPPRKSDPHRSKPAPSRTSAASGSSIHTRPLSSVANGKVSKVPAITITEPPSKDMYAIVDKVSKDHTFHARPGELRIFPATAAYHSSITSALNDSKVPFYTHPIKGEARFRSVLYGIPHMLIDTIWQQLAAHNIRPLSIEYLLSKEEREKNVSTASLASLESNRLRSYVLEFNSTTVSRDLVHSIKYINRHVCKWRAFKSGGNGPTLCNRCCMFGHGQRSCGRATVCLLCADAHSATLCPLSAKPNGSKNYRCINCINNQLNYHHCASSPDCPSRELYRNKRKLANEARNKKPTAAWNTRGGTHRSLPRQSETPLKSRAINRSAPGTSKAQTPHPAATLSKSYAEAVSGNRNRPASSRAPSQPLFSLDECADLLFSAIEELQLCQSKLDQLKVLTGLLKKCLV